MMPGHLRLVELSFPFSLMLDQVSLEEERLNAGFKSSLAKFLLPGPRNRWSTPAILGLLCAHSSQEKKSQL